MSSDPPPTIATAAGLIAGIATAIAVAPRLWDTIWAYNAFLAALNPVPWLLPRELVLTLETAGGVAAGSLIAAAVVGYAVTVALTFVHGAVVS